MPDFPEEWRVAMCSWAQQTKAVQELWLFGSRAKGTANHKSDVDVALVLMPARGAHNWAFGDYVALHDDWRAVLEGIVGRHVSLEAIEPNGKGWAEVHETGAKLWGRGLSS